MILDTTFILDLRHGDSDAVSVGRSLDSSSVRQRLSVMSVFELYTGIVRAADADPEREQLLDVIESKDIVPMDWPIAVRAGRLHGELANDGNRVDVRDCVVAATAIQLEEPILTRNVDHFQRFDGLSVRSY